MGRRKLGSVAGEERRLGRSCFPEVGDDPARRGADDHLYQFLRRKPLAALDFLARFSRGGLPDICDEDMMHRRRPDDLKEKAKPSGL